MTMKITYITTNVLAMKTMDMYRTTMDIPVLGLHILDASHRASITIRAFFEPIFMVWYWNNVCAVTFNFGWGTNIFWRIRP
jgi:hypothetical protein